MTTPDKEEMPTEDRTAVLLATAISYLREEADFNRSWADGRRKVDFGPGSDSEGYKAHRLELAAVREAWADAIEHTCNAHEPMREALILAEKADRIHSKCQECEDGAQAPEACGDCFPSADDARVARRNALKSLGVRMRDVDRARAIKAEPSICNCSQEDVHDYGPCGEDCRSLVVSTLPVNDRHHSAWIVANGSGTKWRYWNIFGPAWTPDREKATRYARREDAEAVHAADEDAWTVQPFVSSVEIPRSSDRQTSSASNGPDDLEPGELLPCPFCGGEPERIDFDEDDGEPENIGGSAITCKRCQCSTAVVFGYKETLFSSWNERAPANARAALKGVPQPATPKEAAMTEAQIKHMVDRFLMWKLPEHFNPDDGISFDPVASKGTPYEFRRSPSGTNLFSAEQATAMVRHMLEGLPQPASDDYQAGAGAPALSEKVIARSEQQRHQKNMLTDLVDAVLYLNDIVGDLDETGKTSSTRLGHLQKAVNRILESIHPTHTGAELNFSNDAERDAVSLKPDTSSQPASEAGKLSSEAES